jgi:hypothetical protein
MSDKQLSAYRASDDISRTDIWVLILLLVVVGGPWLVGVVAILRWILTLNG